MVAEEEKKERETVLTKTQEATEKAIERGRAAEGADHVG